MRLAQVEFALDAPADFSPGGWILVRPDGYVGGTGVMHPAE